MAHVKKIGEGSYHATSSIPEILLTLYAYEQTGLTPEDVADLVHNHGTLHDFELAMEEKLETTEEEIAMLQRDNDTMTLELRELRKQNLDYALELSAAKQSLQCAMELVSALYDHVNAVEEMQRCRNDEVTL